MAEDASIKAYFGGDTTQLQAAINSAHAMTGKFAKESASVFQEVTRAEGELAAFRKQADLQRGAAFSKEIILQREIIALKKSIDAIEGQTVEKIGMQLALEQKILQLEHQIAAAAAKTNAVRASGVSGGGAASSLAGQAAAADKATASFGRLTIAGRALKGALSSIAGITASLFAPQIADKIARLFTGFSEKAEKDLEKLVDSTEKAALKAEKNLEDAKERAAKKDEEYGKMMADQAQLVYEARIKFIENEKEAREKADKEAADAAKEKSKKLFEDDVEWAKKNIELEKKLRDQRIEGLKPEEKILAITKEVADLKKKQAKYTKDDNEYKALQVEINDANKSIEQERLAIAQKTAKEEKKITEEKKTQLGAIAGIMGGSRFNEASDETLAEVSRRNRAEAQRIKGDPFNRGIGQSLEASRLESEAMNAERELSFRRKIRQDFSIGGEAMARKNFQGDPLQFERIYAQLVKGQTTDEKQLDVWQKIEQLARKGIPVVLQGENP